MSPPDDPRPHEGVPELPEDEQQLIIRAQGSDTFIANAAFSALVSPYQAPLERFVSRRLASYKGIEPEDVVQAVRIKMWRRLRSSTPFVLHSGKNVGHFLIKIAANEVTNAVNAELTRLRRLPTESLDEQDRSNGSREERLLADASSERPMSAEWLDATPAEEVERFCLAWVESVPARPGDSTATDQAAYPPGCLDCAPVSRVPNMPRKPMLRALHKALVRLSDRSRNSYILHFMANWLEEEVTLAAVAQRLGIPEGTVGSHVASVKKRLPALLAYELTQEGLSEQDVADILRIPNTELARVIALIERGRALCE